MQSIPNFEILCDLFQKFKNSEEAESTSAIQQMLELDGYAEWLDWMEKNHPNELPWSLWNTANKFLLSMYAVNLR